MKKSALGPSSIKRIDKSDMLRILLKFPRQCASALDIVKGTGIDVRKDFEKIVFAGVGGSAIGADFVKSYVYFESSVPIAVIRDYQLPAYVDNSTLVFISSYSGNTDEALSAYFRAREKKAVIICMSSGGSLKESARKDNALFIEVPQGIPPRCALGFSSIIPLCILARLGMIADIACSIDETVRVLDDLKCRQIGPDVPLKDNIAKYIAEGLYDKFPVIYSDSIHFNAAAVRLRGELAENAKTLASVNVFPETGHNEIMGWRGRKKAAKEFAVLMLRDAFMERRVAKAMEIAKEIIQKQGVEVFDIWSKGESLLSRMFSSIYIGDFISYYLSILYNIDPTPIDRIEYLKKQLDSAPCNS